MTKESSAHFFRHEWDYCWIYVICMGWKNWQFYKYNVSLHLHSPLSQLLLLSSFPPTWPGLRADPKLVTGRKLTPARDNTQSLSVLLLGWSHRDREYTNTSPRSVSPTHGQKPSSVTSEQCGHLDGAWAWSHYWEVTGWHDAPLCSAQDVAPKLDNCPMSGHWSALGVTSLSS